MVCVGIMRSCVRFWIGEFQGNAAIDRDVNTDEGTDFRERAALPVAAVPNRMPTWTKPHAAGQRP